MTETSAPRTGLVALGPVLVAAALTVAAVAVLWLVTLPVVDPDGVCPAIDPAPWWCTDDQIRDRGVRLTQALLLTFGVVVLAATLLHRRWPRAAWLPVLTLPVAGWLAQVAATP